MKRFHFYLFLLLMITIPYEGNTVGSHSPPSPSSTKENLEKKLGRKLKFKEKVALKLLHKRQQKQARNQTTTPTQEFDEFAIAGFTSALFIILSLLISQQLLFLISTVAAIVLSAIGIHRTQGLKGFRKRGRGFAVIGLVCGIISIAFTILIIIALSNL